MRRSPLSFEIFQISIKDTKTLSLYVCQLLDIANIRKEYFKTKSEGDTYHPLSTIAREQLPRKRGLVDFGEFPAEPRQFAGDLAGRGLIPAEPPRQRRQNVRFLHASLSGLGRNDKTDSFAALRMTERFPEQ